MCSFWLPFFLVNQDNPVSWDDFLPDDLLQVELSGQIIATNPPRSPQNVAFWKGNGTPAISGKSRLVKYYNLL